MCIVITYKLVHLQLLSESDEDGFKACLQRDDFSFVFECGFTSSITFQNRLRLLKAVWQHFTCYSIYAELSQLREGLRAVLNFDHLMDSHPKKVCKMLTSGSCAPVNADILLDVLVPSYSELGSNRHAIEETLIHNFSRLLDECDDCSTGFTCADILVFVTGASTFPPLGFSPSPSITFTTEHGLPTASTCVNELCIPHHLQDYLRFKDAFQLAIRGCQGFGQV